MVHIGEDIIRRLDGTSSLWSGVEYLVTICKLIRMAGKFSGLSVRLKELFSDHHRWYQSVICLVTTGLQGCSMYMISSHPKVTLCYSKFVLTLHQNAFSLTVTLIATAQCQCGTGDYYMYLIIKCMANKCLLSIY